MRIELDEKELRERINLNRNRLLNDSYYTIDGIFSPSDYEWYGDKEGRALLAFVSHYNINREKIPCMEQLLEKMPEHMNEDLYFGPKTSEIIHEQQLSGHSWLLRGLCEHYEQFEDAFSLKCVNSIVQHLYMPTLGKYSTYPINRENKNEGEVSGSSVGVLNGWKLSTDIGCAFMSIDGLSHAYRILKDDKLKALIDEMISVYSSIDKVSIKAQTHCTLTAARGMMRMFSVTSDEKYLIAAKNIFNLYVFGGGMTYTYQNLNWWGRPDSWTEPCAVIDSLMLALMLYKVEKKEEYRNLAARIYINGFASLQRDNGGAGTDSLVCPGSTKTELHAEMYEAYFCCTMRLSEGLWYIYENKDLLWSEDSEGISKNENGVYMSGDIIYAEISGGGERYAEKIVSVDGHALSPLLKYYKLPKEIILSTKQKILF